MASLLPLALLPPMLLGLLAMSTGTILLVGGTLPAHPGFLELAILAVGPVPLMLLKKQSLATVPPHANARTPFALAAAMFFAFMVLWSLVVFWLLAINNPHGDWDAQAIWNLHARFLSRGGPAWVNMLTPKLDWSHPDYPLLLPSLVARGWLWSGCETMLVPLSIAFLSTFTCAGLLVTGLALSGRGELGLLAGALLLATPSYIVHGTSQYADTTLSMFFLASTVLVYLVREKLLTSRSLFPAFFLAGCAAWTKNEGLLFLLALGFGCLLESMVRREWRAMTTELAWAAAGALWPLLLLLYFKITLAPANDIVNGQGQGTWTLLTDWWRYFIISRAFAGEMLRFSHGMIVLMVMVALIARVRLPRSGGGLFLVVLLGAMLSGYFGVYLITPRNLYFHLGNSLDRLVLQLWPMGLFFFFVQIGNWFRER